ncbi:SDR family NAD(P)-dependent oxidoreductase [Mycolicibacterium frederiksbergense]|uniref:SDR family NAD(P)-dependent oxidoreductase n=1 Tax=Mycolicibacterium frederiksbergense TaxID=117567 RepID=UPI00265C88C4|nr:SDR family NAD(P)-dependent oxidoreductase [Mycolicibacterium frederiksbergense]MDO0976037.1 SDR family NAD(P)-dependent oxidoreductase [Mycolicibacterium frederiksbergense]
MDRTASHRRRLRPLRRSRIRAYRGGWAVVTGAAREVGLGYAFARQLAAEGMNLILVDVLDEELTARAAELRAEFGIDVRAVPCDMADTNAIEQIESAATGVEIDVLVCNHMFTPADTPRILDMPLDVHRRMIDINARGYTDLVHRFGNQMRSRGRGSIVIVASGVGLTSSPFTGAYGANKAFQIGLGEALWFELLGSGVDVLVMVGGLMNTQGDLFDRYPQWLISEPHAVVRRVLAAVGRKHMLVPSLPNRLFLLAQTRLMSRRRAVVSIGEFMAKGLGKTD